MIVKEKDYLEQALQDLESIAQLADIRDDTRAKVERELKIMRAGERGEANSAYFIDFHYRNKDNWAVIHDLRIEYGGNVAQIDHLLINRILEFYVLESKSYAYGVKITERGEFLFWYNNHYIPVESPIEQNKRHILVLEQLLKRENLLPKRLGMTLSPTFKPYVLVAPKSRVIRPSAKVFNTDMVIKSDELFRQIETNFGSMGALSMTTAVTKMVAKETLEQIAHQLISYHHPITIDYYAKFGIVKPSAAPQPVQNNEQFEAAPTTSGYFCYRCKQAISRKVAVFCFQNKQRFGGKAYCFDCQKVF